MKARLALAAFAVAQLCACAPVAPYQRGYLARGDMAPEPAIGTGKALEKVFASKEGASGGAGVGGGGCGCN